MKPIVVHIALVLLPACVTIDGDGAEGMEANTTANPSGGDDSAASPVPPPDPDAVFACQVSCDELLFFECLFADEHALCRSTCEERSTSALEIFDACVVNTLPVCDLDCYANLVDAEDPVTPTDCVGACEEYFAAGCADGLVGAGSCEEACAQLPSAGQALLIECVALRDGCVLPDFCTGGEVGTTGGTTGFVQ